MHPLLNLVARRPHLLAEHAQAYAELMAAELPIAAAAWQRRVLLNGLALLGLLTSVILAGTALLLWAALASLPPHAPWLLIAVPLLPALGALGCVIAVRGVEHDKGLGELRQQFNADLGMLREAMAA